MNLKIEKIENKFQYACCIYIRVTVFVHEQHCEGDFEIDEYEDSAIHYIGWEDSKPAATARYRMISADTAKVERMAVLKQHRGKGYGRAMIERVIADLKAIPSIKILTMSAQDHAIPLYEKIGYRVVGEGYLEAGIPHHKMTMAAR